MSIAQICGIAVLALTLAAVLRGSKPEYAVFVSIVGGLALLISAIDSLSPILAFLSEATEKTGFALYRSTILKAMGIGLLSQTTADVCRDSGEAAIASKVEFSAKIVILLLALPVLKALLTQISALCAA